MFYVAGSYLGLTIGVVAAQLFFRPLQGISLLLATSLAFFAGSGTRGCLYGTPVQKLFGIAVACHDCYMRARQDSFWAFVAARLNMGFDRCGRFVPSND